MSDKQFRQPGMRRWGEQPGQRGSDRWDVNLVKLDPPPKGQPVLIRPVAGLITIVIHWITWKKQDGGDGAFPVLCPNWNIAAGEDEVNGCPVCRDFHRDLRVSKQDEYLKMGQKFRYLFHAFHVSNIQDGVQDPAKLFGLVETHSLGMDHIENAVTMKGGLVPDDPSSGYCLNWVIKDSKKGSKYGSTEVVFAGADAIPVKEKPMDDGSHSGIWRIKVGDRVVTGTEQQVAAKIPEAPSPEQLHQKLAKFGLYTALERATGMSVGGGGGSRPADDDFGDEAPPPSGGDEDDWNDADDNGSDDAGADWDEAGDASTDDFGDDFDSGPADNEDEAGDDSGDDTGDDFDGEPDSPGAEEADPDFDDWEEPETAPEPEPEPPKSKPSGKKNGGNGGKAGAKQGSSKKQPPKQEPAPAEDDGGDNWDSWDD